MTTFVFVHAGGKADGRETKSPNSSPNKATPSPLRVSQDSPNATT